MRGLMMNFCYYCSLAGRGRHWSERDAVGRRRIRVWRRSQRGPRARPRPPRVHGGAARQTAGKDRFDASERWQSRIMSFAIHFCRKFQTLQNYFESALLNPSRPKAESGGGAGGEEEAAAAAEEGGGTGTPTSAAAAAAPAGSDPNSEEALLQVRTRIDWPARAYLAI